MPVLLAGFDAHRIACDDLPDGFTPFLYEPAPVFHEQQLRRAVAMPVGAPAGIELDEIHDNRLAPFLDHRQPLHPGRPDEVLRIRRRKRDRFIPEMLHGEATTIMRIPTGI